MEGGTSKVGEETPSALEPLLDPQQKEEIANFNTTQAMPKTNQSLVEEKKEAPAEDAKPAIDPEDIIVNNTDRSIDFDQELKQLKARTELDIPYVSTMVEDAMYIDQHTVVTIEYHYYQNGVQYTHLGVVDESINAQGKLVGPDGNPKPPYALGTDNYQADMTKEVNPNSHFDRCDLRNLYDKKTDLLKNEMYNKNTTYTRVQPGYQTASTQQDIQAALMKKTQQMMQRTKSKKERKEEDQERLIEGIVAQYKVSNSGNMQRINEAPLNMGRNFIPSLNGNMQMVRSRDKSKFTIVNFQRDQPQGKYFKIVAFTTKLEPVDLGEAINEGMSQYFSQVRDKFDSIVEISLVGKSKYVQMVWIESVKRDMEEQQQYELDINKEQSLKLGSQRRGTITPTFELRQAPRKARKYTYFEVETGKLTFEYGGVHKATKVTNQNGQEVEMFELGIRVKECREEQFHPYLFFYIAGDFLETNFKKRQVGYQWMLIFKSIDLETLFSHETQEEKSAWLQEQLINSIPGHQDADFGNQYLFDENWILKQYYTWEECIHLSANRTFTQFALINQPKDPHVLNPVAYYVNGPKFKGKNETEKKEYHVPYAQKHPNDAILAHGRNAIIKDNLFFTVKQLGVIKTYCVRLDQKTAANRIKCFNMDISGHLSEHDCWMQQKKQHDRRIIDICQTLSVQEGGDHAVLRSRVPETFIGSMPVKFSNIERKTTTFYQQNGDHPFLCYNLGSSKIVIQNTLKSGQGKTFILDLLPGDEFISFVKFKSFQDIGFFTGDLRIECCSHFLFITQNDNAKNGMGNRFNLLLVDPFYKEFQACWFRSVSFFDDEILKSGEFVQSAIVQSNASRKSDKNYKVYLWTQHSTQIIRSKWIKREKNAKVDAEDSDNVKDEEDIIKKEMEDDAFGFDDAAVMEPINMIQDSRGFIYYIMSLAGEQRVMEGNPQDPYIKNHEIIYSLKTDKCLAFSCKNASTFFFMDDAHCIHKLVRSENNRKLHDVKTVTLKEIQRYDFIPRQFEPFLLQEKYGVYRQKMFYFYDETDDPFPEGILESDELVEIDRTQAAKTFFRGPFTFSGSNRFYECFRQNKFKSFMRCFFLPDAVQRTLINDFANAVDISTYLESGDILLRSRRRFMVFTKDASFKAEVGFNNEAEREDDDDHEVTIEDLRAMMSKVEPTEIEIPKKKDPYLDFKGNIYMLEKEPPAPPVSDLNKMTLLQFSYNNQFFLFHNRMSDKLVLYELVNEKITNEQGFFGLDLKQLVAGAAATAVDNWDFKFKYELKYKDCSMFNALYGLGIDALKYFVNNPVLIKVNNKAQVQICHCESRNPVEPDSDGSVYDSEMIQVQLRGAIFSQNGNLPFSKCEGFSKMFDFPIEAQTNVINIINDQIKEIQRKITQIRVIQTRWPETLHDYGEYDNLIKDEANLGKKDTSHVFAKQYYDDLVVIYKGNYLKYGFLTPNPKKSKIDPEEWSFKKDNGLYFQDIACEFTPQTEIIQLIETSLVNVLQIITKNHAKNIVTILLWDFAQNIEYGQIQKIPDTKHFVGNHVVKGMNYKMNYFLNQDHLIDLEHNIPIRQQNVDQGLDPASVSYSKQLAGIINLFNQRKIFKDTKMYLGVEKAHCLYYDLSKIDILLWKNLCELGEKPAMIETSASLDNMNLCFNGVSLFHYFAPYADTIQMMFEKLELEGAARDLTNSEKTIPLQILNPDNDAKTALYRAVQSQSPKSFEIMVIGLIGINDICTTKMMLKSLALVLSSDNEDVIDFFKYAIYQPPQMALEQFVPWREGMDAVVFPCHTSVISQNLLLDKLEEYGGIDTTEMKKSLKKQARGVSVEKPVQTKSAVVALKKKLRNYTLDKVFDTGLPDGQEPLKRVSVQALDMDWLFQNDNCKSLLEVLGGDSNTEVLTRHSIKVFVELMWEVYQPAILKWMFGPYVIYLIIINYNAGSLIGRYLTLIETQSAPGYVHTQEDDDYRELMRFKGLVLSILALGFLFFFASLEYGQLMDSGWEYFSDVWNFIDMSSAGLNLTFCGLFLYTIATGGDMLVSFSTIHIIAAFGCFLMWLKVFYWCRLFGSLAYYVKLIQQTIADSLNFMLMVLVILISFGSFLYVSNRILRGKEDQLGEYFNNEVIDSVISVYMLGALGDFDTSRYKNGNGKYYVMAMFLAATFVVSVIFMNMLIAIMGDTFGQVQEGAEQNGLQEQVQLICDHLWLLDLEEIFKGNKYIIIMAPSKSVDDEDDRAVIQVNKTQNFLDRRIYKMNQNIERRIENVETNSSFMLSNQYTAIGLMMSRLRDISEQVQQGNDDATDRFEKAQNKDGDQKEKKLSSTDMKMKKKDLQNSINRATAHLGKMTKAKLKKMAKEYVDLVDADQNGMIERSEFHEFFLNFDGICLNESEIDQLFNEADRDHGGHLSVQEFSDCLFQIIIPEGFDDMADE